MSVYFLVLITRSSYQLYENMQVSTLVVPHAWDFCPSAVILHDGDRSGLSPRIPYFWGILYFVTPAESNNNEGQVKSEKIKRVVGTCFDIYLLVRGPPFEKNWLIKLCTIVCLCIFLVLITRSSYQLYENMQVSTLVVPHAWDFCPSAVILHDGDRNGLFLRISYFWGILYFVTPAESKNNKGQVRSEKTKRVVGTCVSSTKAMRQSPLPDHSLFGP